MITAALLRIIEEAGEGVMTLMDGVEATDFERSRLTRSEVRRLLQRMGETLDTLPEGTRAALPEIDWPGWRTVGLALASPALAGDDAAWFAARSLVPATLSWLRVYQRESPALFRFAP